MALGRPPDDGVDPRNTLPCQTDLQLIANPNIQHLPAGHRANVNPLHAFIIQPLGLKLGHHVESAAAAGTETDRPYLHHPRCRRIFQAASHSPFPGDQTRPGGSRPSRTITPSLTKGSGERYQRWRHCATCSMLDTGWVYCPLYLNPACVSSCCRRRISDGPSGRGPDKNVQLTERRRRVGSHHQPGDFRPRVHPPQPAAEHGRPGAETAPPCSTLSASSPVITFSSAGICRARAVHASPRRPSPRLMA